MYFAFYFPYPIKQEFANKIIEHNGTIKLKEQRKFEK